MAVRGEQEDEEGKEGWESVIDEVIEVGVGRPWG